jgi:hypothetical protein
MLEYVLVTLRYVKVNYFDFNVSFTVHFYDSTIFIPTNAQLDFFYNKLGLHVSAYQAIIRAPITKNTENTASQNKLKP